MAIRVLKIMTFLCVLALFGCARTPSHDPSESAEVILKEDLQSLYTQTEDIPKELDLASAIERAVRLNLDAQVAQMETVIASNAIDVEAISAMGKYEVTYNYSGRSNPGASSSRSVSTGVQSLEPSISSEPDKRTAKFELSWDILDTALAIARTNTASDQALIAEERYRKVLQNIVQDVYISHWKGAVAQSLLPKIKSALNAAEDQIKKTRQALEAGILPIEQASTTIKQITEKHNELFKLKSTLELALIELKVLTNIPEKDDIKIQTASSWSESPALPVIDADIEELQTMALLNRPELQEELLNKKIALRTLQSEILKAFPGIEVATALNRDVNKFLIDNEWTTISLNIAQNLVDIITLPLRYRKANNEKHLADIRRKAMIVAVLTQVQVAKARLENAKENYGFVKTMSANDNEAKRIAQNKKKAGLLSEGALLLSQLNALSSAAEEAFAFTDTQEAYIKLLITTGINPWKEGVLQGTQTVEELLEKYKGKLLSSLKENLPVKEVSKS